MKRLGITLLLISCLASAFSQLKYRQKLGGLAQINFPDTAEVIDAKLGINVYRHQTLSEIYFAQVSPLKKSLMDVLRNYNNEKMFQTYIASTCKSTEGKIIYQHKQNFAGLEGYEWAATAKLDSGRQTVYTYNRIVFMNDTLLSFGIWSADSLKRNDATVATYFKTFKVTAKDIVSSDSESAAYQTGTLLGKLLFLMIPVAIILLIVFLVKRNRRKKPRTFNPDDYQQP